MPKNTSRPMSSKDAARIQSAGDRHPKSQTAKSGFTGRAQRTAANQDTARRKP